MSSNTTVLSAFCEARDCFAEFLLNGIPLARLGAEVFVQSQSVAELVRSGTNRLEIVLEPGPSPRFARLHEREIDRTKGIARFEIFEIEPDLPAQPEYGRVLAALKLDLPPDEPAIRRGPTILSTMFEASERPRWRFEDAPALSMDEALEREALDIVEEVAGAFRAGDVEAYLRLAQPALSDALKAYPAHSEATLRGDVEEVMKWFLANRGTVRPIAASDFEPRLVADGRLIECVNRDFSPSLRLAGPEMELPYSMFLGRIDGALRIVRF
jgi:hypothetical protein